MDVCDEFDEVQKLQAQGINAGDIKVIACLLLLRHVVPELKSES
jgi:hypothetical protein